MACQPTLSSLNCPVSMTRAVHSLNIAFACISGVVAVVLIIAVTRRWWLLREKLNRMWAMKITDSIWIPAWCYNYAASLNDPPAYPTFISITFWIAWLSYAINTLIVLSFFISFVSVGTVATPSGSSRLHYGLSFICGLYALVIIIASALAGQPQYYPWAERLLLTSTAGMFLTFGSFLLWKRHEIRCIIQKCAESITESVALARLKQFRHDLVWTMNLWMVIHFPFAFTMIFHAIFMKYVDSNVWSTILCWSIYRASAMFRISASAFYYWSDTTVKLNTQSASSSSFSPPTTSSSSPNPSSTYAASTQTGPVTIYSITKDPTTVVP